MQHLNKLLEIENSDLARVLRLGLHGLRSQLQQALKEATLDPGISVCNELLNELNSILEPAPLQKQLPDETVLPPENHSDNWGDIFEPVPQPDNSSLLTLGTQLRLHRICSAIVSNQQLQEFFGEFQLKSTNDSDLWNEIQCLLLRSPATVADSMRQRAREIAISAGAAIDERSQRQLPFSRNESLYPGLSGIVQASGLRLSDNLPLEEQITGNKLEGNLYFLAGVVSTYIKFIDLDSSLHHALKSVDQFGVRSLNSESERSKYIAALIDRFRRALAAQDDPNPAVTLRARLDLDEAINSLVYLPPVDRSSWWGKLQQESRRTLKSVVEKALQAGIQVVLRPLWGPYADVRALSKDDLELDSGGIRGEVSACLRVYAKIDKEVFPGRVLFRSLR